jgi:H+/gluconate symporter-like permease
MLSLIGLVAALALLIALTIRGMNLFVATPLCALVIALTAGLPLLPPLAEEGEANLLGAYMSGFTSFVASWFFMFLLGSIFGKLMEDTGAADSVARWAIRGIGPQRAALAVVVACAILTYGGVSLFVVAFSVYPTALSLFRVADLPRRFIPATLAFGSVTFTMTSAGSPEIQNWIPIQYLGTSPWAAWQASLVTAVFMMLVGYAWLGWMLRRATARGERFEDRDGDPHVSRDDLPAPWRALLGPLAVLVVSFALHDRFQTSALILALLAGCVVTVMACMHHRRDLGHAIGEGSTGALIAIGNTAAVVGFGAVAKASPAFTMAVDAITHLPGSGVATAALAVSVIAAITGSASGGQAIALPILAPLYLAQGVNPEQLHRSVAISSGVLDSLPHNGYVVTTIRAICKETHAAAYGAMGAMTVVVPGLGLLLCLALFAFGL